jgi:hypothetical protein
VPPAIYGVFCGVLWMKPLQGFLLFAQVGVLKGETGRNLRRPPTISVPWRDRCLMHILSTPDAPQGDPQSRLPGSGVIRLSAGFLGVAGGPGWAWGCVPVFPLLQVTGGAGVPGFGAVLAGHVFTVKLNTPALQDELDALGWASALVQHATQEQGHGRRERRTIQVADAPAHVARRFPHARQVALVQRYVTRTVRVRKGKRWVRKQAKSAIAVFTITSLSAREAAPEHIAGYVRGHWDAPRAGPCGRR